MSSWFQKHECDVSSEQRIKQINVWSGLVPLNYEAILTCITIIIITLPCQEDGQGEGHNKMWGLENLGELGEIS